MTIKFSNNAVSTLAGSLTNSATSVSVAAGDGVKFPQITAPDYFFATLIKLVGGVSVDEIVKVTAISGDVLTILRGQEGKTATTFAGGDRIEQRLTADPLNNTFAKLDAANTFAQPITLPGAPTNPLHAVPKSYVDAQAVSLTTIHAAILSF